MSGVRVLARDNYLDRIPVDSNIKGGSVQTL